MDLYTIDSKYIKYLKQFEPHIWDNDEKGNLRPYTGVILNIGNQKYYAPLSSPKAKHEKMQDRFEFIRLEHNKQLKGVINLNNIIPVSDNLVKKIVINNVTDKYYKSLLDVELYDIRRKAKTIKRNANTIYYRTTKYRNEPQNKKLVSMCYDFKLLEEKCKEYGKNLDISKNKPKLNSELNGKIDTPDIVETVANSREILESNGNKTNR